MKTGIRIKELRLKKGMTQEELAFKTEVSARTIQRIENGEVDPRAYTLQMIAKALEVDFSMFNDKETEENDRGIKADNLYWLALIHLSSLFLLIVPTFLIWNRKKAEISLPENHFSDVVNFQLSMWILFILPGIFVLLVTRMPYILFLSLTASAIFTVLNTIRVLNNKPYRYLNILKKRP
jgi:transcriptional regulator with XRE-family HTH domain